MKKYYILYTALILSLISCSDFLEEKSKDLVIPKTVSEYKEFILGEAYYNNTDLTHYLDVMTDDVDEYLDQTRFLSNDDRKATYGYYTWQEDTEIDFDGSRKNDNAWKKLYHRILISNIIIDNIGDIDGNINEKDDLKAEAHFFKAYSYFMLANLYGKPYNKETAESDLCVPINNESSVEDIYYKRESVAKVYKEIEDNIEESIRLFEKSGIDKSKFRINKYAAYLLAARTYLFEKKYQEAIDNATKVIDLKGTLYNLNEYSAISFINEKNPEILFSFQTYSFSKYNYDYKTSYRAAPELMNLYAKNDIRKTCFFKDYPKGYMPLKWASNTSVYGFTFRTAEAYLIRAEANAELDKKDLAMADIDILKQKRYFYGDRTEKDAEGNDITVTYSFSKEQAANKEEAIEKVRNHRRMELCFEYSRWFDLRRWGGKKIVHTYTDTKSGDKKTFILEKDDPAYTLQVPKMVTERNNSMKKNERPEREGK